MRVLLVEDNALNQELARDLLEAAGHDVDVVDDGEAFRARLADGARPDLVLMDVLLPGVDGATLVRELRDAGATLPVVAVTAHVQMGESERLLAAGFNAVITKPIDTRTFVARLERCMPKPKRQ